MTPGWQAEGSTGRKGSGLLQDIWLLRQGQPGGQGQLGGGHCRDTETEGLGGRRGRAGSGWVVSDCVEVGGGVAWTPWANEVVWGPVLGVSSMSPPQETKAWIPGVGGQG